jgi:hypothetical protein
MLKQQKAVEQQLARLGLLLRLCLIQRTWAGERVCTVPAGMADNTRSWHLSDEPNQPVAEAAAAAAGCL